MFFGDILELVITLLIFLVIWVLPRIIAARTADKKRRAKNGLRSAAKASAKSVSEPTRSWSKELFSRLTAEVDGLDTGKTQAAVEAPVSEGPQVEERIREEAPETGSAYIDKKEQGDSLDLHEESPNLENLKKVSKRRKRTPLQTAIIWKELLDRPKALRREPFS